MPRGSQSFWGRPPPIPGAGPAPASGRGFPLPNGSSKKIVNNFAKPPHQLKQIQESNTKLLLEINKKLDNILKTLNCKGSFYKIIDKEKYLRSLLNEADHLAISGGRISEDEVLHLIEIVNHDGTVSELENRTLIFILNNYNLTTPAKNALLKFTVETHTK